MSQRFMRFSKHFFSFSPLPWISNVPHLLSLAEKGKLKQVAVFWTPAPLSFTSLICHRSHLILQPVGSGSQPVAPPVFYSGNIVLLIKDAKLPGRHKAHMSTHDTGISISLIPSSVIVLSICLNSNLCFFGLFKPFYPEKRTITH